MVGISMLESVVVTAITSQKTTLCLGLSNFFQVSPTSTTTTSSTEISKPRTSFLTKSNIIKIGDFGISKQLGTKTDFARTYVGTPYYLSPEMCEDLPYNTKSDVWALGCILYELCSLRHAFTAKSIPALVMSILRGIYEPIPSMYSSQINDLIKMMLEVDPARRPSVNELTQVPYVREWSEKFVQRSRGIQRGDPVVKDRVVFEDGKGIETWKKEKENQLGELELMLAAHKNGEVTPVNFKNFSPAQPKVESVRVDLRNHVTPPIKPPKSLPSSGRSLSHRRVSPRKQEEIQKECRDKRRHKVRTSSDIKVHEQKFKNKLKNVKSRISQFKDNQESPIDRPIEIKVKDQKSRVTPKTDDKSKEMGDSFRAQTDDQKQEAKSTEVSKPKPKRSGFRDFIQKKRQQLPDSAEVGIEVLTPGKTPSKTPSTTPSNQVDVPIVILAKSPPRHPLKEVEEERKEEEITESEKESVHSYTESECDRSQSHSPRGISPTPEDFNRCQMISTDYGIDDVDYSDHMLLPVNFDSSPGYVPGSTPLFQTENFLSSPPQISSRSDGHLEDEFEEAEMEQVIETMKTMMKDEFYTCKEIDMGPKNLENLKSGDENSSLHSKIDELREFCEKQLTLESFKSVYNILKNNEKFTDANWELLDEILGEKVFLLGCIQRILTLEKQT
ncbi:hypothetical protein GEMRC1_003949 [Eukaryota sp. GEM-RC1]